MGCWNGTGSGHSARSCCRNMEGLPLCSHTSGTPCNLVTPIRNVFEGVMGVNPEGSAGDMTSDAAQLSIAQALAAAVNVDATDVEIQAVAEQARMLSAAEAFKPFVRIRYAITVPYESQLNIEMISNQ